MREIYLSKRQEARKHELMGYLERAHAEEQLHIREPLRRGGIACARVRLDAIKRWEKELNALL